MKTRGKDMNNVNTEKRLPSVTMLIAIMIIFVVVMFGSIVILELPIQLALLLVWFVIMGFGIYLKYSYFEMERGLLKGIHEGMGATLILIAVGALIGSWIAGGVVLVSYLLSMVPKISKYLPTQLMDGTSLIYGKLTPEDYTAALIITAALSAACFIISIPVFNKKSV